MKNFNLLFVSCLILYLLIIPMNTPHGCTAFMLKTNEGIVTGRTMVYDQTSVYNTQVYTKGQLLKSVYMPPPKIPYS